MECVRVRVLERALKLFVLPLEFTETISETIGSFALRSGVIEFLPTLSRVSALRLASRGPVSAGVTASAAFSLGYSRPIPSNALPIDPHLTFPHASHVQG